MLGETKKSFKIFGWCLVVVSLFLAVNYFVYSNAHAETNKVKMIDGDYNYLVWEQWVTLDKTNCDTKSETDSTTYWAKTRNFFDTGWDSYYISNLYLSFNDKNKISVYYDSEIDGLDITCEYGFYISFVVIDDEGNEISVGPLSWYEKDYQFYRTEKRSDKSGKGDHFTYNTTDSSDFQNNKVLDDLHNELIQLGVNSVVVNGQTKNVESCSLKDLVRSGHCKIILTGGFLDD